MQRNSLLEKTPNQVFSPPRSIRRIRELYFAELCAPVFPPAKLSGSKALGIRYEKACSKRVKRWFKEHEVLHNPWIKFADANGNGFACPDIVVLRKDSPGILFECKLSWTPLALDQLRFLYLPLCEKVFNCSFSLIVMCKNWRGTEAPRLDLISHPAEAGDGISVLLWSS